MEAAKSPSERQRLDALRGYAILDTPREADFDDIVALAAQICEVPIAVINLIDSDRQWFKAEIGLGVRETPLDTSICAHALLQPGVFEVPDTLLDPRFADNPLCTGEPHLRFYTGALLETPDGLPLGTLCVLDHQPRKLTDAQIFALTVLSRQVMSQLELKRSLATADLLMREMDHRVKNSLSLVVALLGLQARAAVSEETRAELAVARDRVGAVVQLHDVLHRSARHERVEMAQFLDQIVQGLRDATDESVTIAIDAGEIWMTTSQASAAGLLVNELVTNALKHAFPDGRAGRVAVSFTRTGDEARLVVADDGVGLPAGFALSGDGLGMRLVRSLAGTLAATVEIGRPERGSAFSLAIPIG